MDLDLFSSDPRQRPWPDGQVRPEEPYRCGCFMASPHAGYAQCTLLSDHDGGHVFADPRQREPDINA